MKSQEFIAEDSENIQKQFSQAFAKAKIPVHTVDVTASDDNWVKISAKGTKHFRAGTAEKLQFVVADCWWDPVGDEMSGKIFSQGSSYDKKYSQVADFDSDQFSLDEFVAAANEFVSNLANAEAEKYNQGEREYWAKGGRGMMPGSVTKAE